MIFHGTVKAQETGTTGSATLSTVFVQAEIEMQERPGGFIYRNSRTGVLGSIDTMDIPFTQFNYTEQTVEDFGLSSLPLNLVLVNNPSIRSSNTSPLYSDFSIRGINANGNNFYLNGVPNLFAQFLTPPNHIIQSIDVISGPNTVLFGSTTSVNGTNGYTAPNGIISVTTKRATIEPVTRYTQTFSGRGAFGEYIDIGRRFGQGNAWGVRLNAEYLDGDMAVAGMVKKARNIFIDVDHAGENSITNFFGGYFDVQVSEGQRWFNLSSASTAIMAAPDSKRSFSYDGMIKVMHGVLLTLNHDHKINDNWNVFLTTGMTDRNGYRSDDIGGSLAFNGNTGIINDQMMTCLEANRNEYLQIGVRGKVALGEVINNLSLVWDWSFTRNYMTEVDLALGTLTGSIFTGVTANVPIPGAGPALLINDEYTQSITLADHLEYKQFGLIVAMQYRRNKFRAYNTSRQVTEDSKHNGISPSFAITFKPLDNLLIYASHSQGYTRARTVGTAYANRGELMHPLKNKQFEIGAKYETDALIATLSLFSVDQGLTRDETIDGLNYLRVDGKSDYKGVELNVNGQLTDKWSIMGGFLYLNAKRKNTTGGRYDNMYVQGVAKWSGVIATEYAITENDVAMGRVVYTGPAYVTDANKVELPSWVSLDLGFKHKIDLDPVDITLSATCFNVLGNDYWLGRGGTNVIGLSMPRTFAITAQFDF
ncbi:MAG: TonB-dependent receptor [Deltaproteobacteria bacterium]|nr:TonB-dependent receptor [Deltaproteobacteria bacterium]